MPQHTGNEGAGAAVAAQGAALVPCISLPPANTGAGEESPNLCMPGPAICSAAYAAGAGMAEPFHGGFQGRMLLFLNDTHVAGSCLSVLWEERSQDLETENFTQPLLCLGKLFLYPVEMGKPGWPETQLDCYSLKTKLPAAWL